MSRVGAFELGPVAAVLGLGCFGFRDPLPSYTESLLGFCPLKSAGSFYSARYL
jgi:hypothetical protein